MPAEPEALHGRKTWRQPASYGDFDQGLIGLGEAAGAVDEAAVMATAAIEEWLSSHPLCPGGTRSRYFPMCASPRTM
jgi:hypothetical protein